MRKDEDGPCRSRIGTDLFYLKEEVSYLANTFSFHCQDDDLYGISCIAIHFILDIIDCRLD